MSYYRKKKTGKKFLITITILSILIISSSLYKPMSKVSNEMVNGLLKPVNKVSFYISEKIKIIFEEVFGSKKTIEDVKRLSNENQKLLTENANLKNIVNKEEFLKNEFEAINNSEDRLIKAFVINKDQSAYSDKFTIDKGSKNGVKKGDTVFVPILDEDYNKCIVGKIDQVNNNTSTVDVITNSSNNLSFVNSNSGDYGIIDSYHDGKLEGYMLDLSGEVNTGDILLSSGIGGVYPSNYYIGRVKSVEISRDGLRKNVTVETKLDFSHLFRVLIIDHKGEINE